MADSVGTKNIWPYYSSQNVQAAAREPVKQLGKDEFLQILVTQLRYQDPMQPMQDKEFIAQMAQFSSLEQMMNMTKEITALKQSAGMATGLIGKQIEWYADNVEEGGQSVVQRGTVDSIIWTGGVQYAQIGDLAVPIDKIISISEPSAEEGGNGESQPEVTGDE
ncbi:flagellar hook assembly protein FlgD [Cohnella sp. CIP 111063]|uniref:flagellar hook capping FlgD N-terminal domain-containing protein n=1 Tax=unclassified Cohnella TaxID=2636738 RepID=UPI000B8BF898|nr:MULTISPECIES: flagellar hook capping FlgD N-terminal domain-containing protein [unclassified Cohnella]OXS59677.1 flagellar hook assembly protein FlgD [Cohnella sp. CIP 111063]PRX72467.1 flagellar basal-body rod modification protein FlgD [Cohnella sp. SGD-V74]